MEVVTDFLFWTLKSLWVVTAAMKSQDVCHEITRCLLLGRKAMRNLDVVLKSRDVTLPIKVYIFKAMVFPVVMYIVRAGS